jgi:hypothetical protein
VACSSLAYTRASSDRESATDERLRYKIHGDPRCRCGRKIDGQYWLVVGDTFEAACEPCASAYGDPRIAPRASRRSPRRSSGREVRV